MRKPIVCDFTRYIKNGLLEIAAPIPRGPAVSLDVAKGRIGDRTIEIAEVSWKLEYVCINLGNLGSGLLSYCDVVGTKFHTHDVEFLGAHISFTIRAPNSIRSIWIWGALLESTFRFS
jgi:hypothetical protein